MVRDSSSCFSICISWGALHLIKSYNLQCILAIFMNSEQFKDVAATYFILTAFEECNDRWCCCSREQMRSSFKLLSLAAEYRYMVLSTGISFWVQIIMWFWVQVYGCPLCTVSVFWSKENLFIFRDVFLPNLFEHYRICCMVEYFRFCCNRLPDSSFGLCSGHTKWTLFVWVEGLVLKQLIPLF